MSNHTISTALHELGIPSSLLGYEYLAYGIGLALNERELIHRITKGLYPAVAKHFGSTPSRIERAIRHAIEAAWLRGTVDAQESYFGNSIDPMKGKPTNREFIAAVAERIRLAE